MSFYNLFSDQKVPGVKLDLVNFRDTLVAYRFIAPWTTNCKSGLSLELHVIHQLSLPPFLFIFSIFKYKKVLKNCKFQVIQKKYIIYCGNWPVRLDAPHKTMLCWVTAGSIPTLFHVFCWVIAGSLLTPEHTLCWLILHSTLQLHTFYRVIITFMLTVLHNFHHVELLQAPRWYYNTHLVIAEVYDFYLGHS